MFPHVPFCKLDIYQNYPQTFGLYGCKTLIIYLQLRAISRNYLYTLPRERNPPKYRKLAFTNTCTRPLDVIYVSNPVLHINTDVFQKHSLCHVDFCYISNIYEECASRTRVAARMCVCGHAIFQKSHVLHQ